QPARGGPDARRDLLLRRDLYHAAEAAYFTVDAVGRGVRRGAGGHRLGGCHRVAVLARLAALRRGVLLAAAALLGAGHQVPRRLPPGGHPDASGGRLGAPGPRGVGRLQLADGGGLARGLALGGPALRRRRDRGGGGGPVRSAPPAAPV